MATPSSDACKRSGSSETSPANSPKKVKTEKDEKSREDERKKKEEEKQILELMNLILDVIIDLKKVPEKDIFEARQFIIDSFATFSFPDVNLSEWKNSCAFLLRYGLHGAGLTRCKTLEALQNWEDLALTLQKPDLNVISLGGGPGNDVIGFCSALYEYQIQRHLNITVTDSVREWSTYVNLGKVLIAEGNYGNVSELFQRNDVNLSFLQVKLPGNPTVDKKYFEILAEADIVLITKLFSILEFIDKEDIVKNLYEKMKHEALIFFIDSPFERKLWSNFEVMHISKEGDEYMYASSAQNIRFDCINHVSTKARIAVLRKK